jgi:ribosomal protein L37AE/L43A
MSKGHRGKGIKSLVKHGRAACPVCQRSAVKVLYEVTIKEKTVKVCKTCKAALAHGRYQKEADALVSASTSATAPAPAPESTPAT